MLCISAYTYICEAQHTLLMQAQEQIQVSSVRLSHKLKLRLAKIKARLLLKDGKDRSMEELIELLADTYESQEKDKK
jgi:hypothetical protein